MKPYMPLEGQIGALQMRLMRAARAFLDPMVNLGQITPAGRAAIPDERSRAVGADGKAGSPTAIASGRPARPRRISTDTSVSRGSARKAEMALGDRFDQLSYHDFVINQGMLPPDLLEQAVMERYVAERARDAAVTRAGAGVRRKNLTHSRASASMPRGLVPAEYQRAIQFRAPNSSSRSICVPPGQSPERCNGAIASPQICS